MRVVDQVVENAICQRGASNPLVPTGNRQLSSQDRRTHLVTVLSDLKSRRSGSESGAITQSSIDYQDIDAAETGKQTA